jgi:transcription elongation GreA/GreB family factor
MSYDIGFPGDGDADEGYISADSSLGSAILGSQVGDVVDVSAPAGR